VTPPEGGALARPVRRLLVGLAGTGAVAGAAHAATRALARRGAPAGSASDPDLAMPADVVHHRLPMADGGKVHVVERGSGPVVVLLHGAGLSSETWAYQFHDLASSHRLVAVDLRGHGESEPGRGTVTIEQIAGDLAEVLHELDLRRLVLVGHSMGGMAVLRLARLRPEVIRERVGSVLLMSTASGVLPQAGLFAAAGPLAARTAVGVDAAVNRSGRFGIPKGRLGWLASRVGFGAAAAPAQVAAALDMLRRTPPSVFVGLFPEIMAFDERAPFTELGVPVTVLVGDRDWLTPPAFATALASGLPGARLLVWHGAGHMLMYERRESLDWLLESLARSATIAGAP